MNEIIIKGVNCHPGEGEGFSGLDADLTGKKLIGIVAEIEEQAILLLRILAGLHQPAEGEVFYNRSSIYGISDDERSKLIRRNSFVFDTGGLVSNLSVLENISLTYDFVHEDGTEEKKMSELKKMTGLFGVDESILTKRPSSLNKNEIKIINYIRALIIDPEVAFIELPFSRLSKSNERMIEDLIIKRSFQKEKTHIFATQRYSKLMEKADAVIAIKKGQARYFPRDADGVTAFDFHQYFEVQEIS